MRRGLPGLQQQHQPTLWKLRELRLLPQVGCLLQRDLHLTHFGFEQLRCLRIRLCRIISVLHPGHMRPLPAGLSKLQWLLRRPFG
jgi:hypothetical protein